MSVEIARHDFTAASNSRSVDALSSNAVHTSESGNRVEDNPYLRFAGNALISDFLAAVIEATAADFGTVQLFDSINGVLRIVARHGFQSEFLNYFDTVSHSKECVCGAAMKRRSRIVVTDIATDPLFSDESGGVLLRANVRSVQSTPLIDSLGKFVGIASTHYSRSNGITPDGLAISSNSSKLRRVLFSGLDVRLGHTGHNKAKSSLLGPYASILHIILQLFRVFVRNVLVRMAYPELVGGEFLNHAAMGV